MKLALINKVTNLVDNVVVWESPNFWNPGPTYDIVPLADSDFVGPGFSFNPETNTFTPPIEEIPVE